MGKINYEPRIHAVNDILSAFLLISVPGLPLLLAFPALHRRLPWPGLIALLPATILLFISADIFIELPWMLLGGGLGIDSVSRWWLAMAVVTWAAVAAFLHVPGGRGACNRLATLFLLTMAGQMGAILATDMVSFFTFMTLMGYAFIGLLVADGDERVRRAGRVYLVLLIFADIALLEALLVAAASTNDLGFAVAAGAMTLSPFSVLYLSMAIAGFALKTGVWPLHVWLPLAYGSARPPVALLLWGVPVATGLFGAVRWLPLGEITAPIPGMLLQAVGAVGILYATLFGLMRAQWIQLPAYVAIIATGMFAMGLGAGLRDPSVWNQYGDSAPVFVVLVGLGLAIMVVGLAWLEASGRIPSGFRKTAGAALWLERWVAAVVRWGCWLGISILPGLRALWLVKWGRLWKTSVWQRAFNAGEHFLQRWVFAITLFLLLGMTFVVLLLLDAMSFL